MNKVSLRLLLDTSFIHSHSDLVIAEDVDPCQLFDNSTYQANCTRLQLLGFVDGLLHISVMMPSQPPTFPFHSEHFLANLPNSLFLIALRRRMIILILTLLLRNGYSLRFRVVYLIACQRALVIRTSDMICSLCFL